MTTHHQEEQNLKDEVEKRPELRPFPATFHTKLYAMCAALNSVNLGYDIGVGTNAGPLIMDDFQLSDGQLEMFLGSINFWSILGALSSPLVSDKYGRRATLATAAIGIIVGVGVTATAPTFPQLLLGRMIVGLAVGIGEAIDPMYIAEISPSHCRGALVSWAEFGIAFGVVLGFASSLIPGISWRGMLALGGIMPMLLMFLVAFVMPESPRWLVEKDQVEKARGILAKIYPSHITEDDNNDFNYDEDAPNDLELTAAGESSTEPSAHASAIDRVVRDIQFSLEVEHAAAHAVGWRAIFHPSPAIRRMLLAGVGMAAIQQLCGIDAIMFYLMFVIRQTGITSNQGQIGALITLGVIKLIFVMVGASLIDRVGRRPLLFTSLIGCAASLLVVSGTFLVDSQASQVGTVVALAFFLAFFSIGLGPGNWVVVSEIFATSIRAKAMCVAVFANRVSATIMATTFLTLANLLTWSGFFIMLTLICLGGAAFLYKYLPETKNRSLESMSHYFAEITGDSSILDAELQLRKLQEEKLRTAEVQPRGTMT